MTVGATSTPSAGWSPPISNQGDPNRTKADQERQAAADALKALEQQSARRRAAGAVPGSGGGCGSGGCSGGGGIATNPDQDAIDQMVRMGYSPAAAAKAIQDAKAGSGCAQSMGCPSCGGGACTCASMSCMQ